MSKRRINSRYHLHNKKQKLEPMLGKIANLEGVIAWQNSRIASLGEKIIALEKKIVMLGEEKITSDERIRELREFMSDIGDYMGIRLKPHTQHMSYIS